MSTESQAKSATPPAPPSPASPSTPNANVTGTTTPNHSNAIECNSPQNSPPHSPNEPQPPRTNDLKRKTPPMASLAEDVDRKPIILPPGANLPAGEYETGRVICQACGGAVSFRDDAGGGAFTLKHWEAHRLTCSGGGGAHPPPSHPNSNSHHYTPTRSAVSAANAHALSIADGMPPPAKRRRAKRTEDERIEYLRADAHVAQFEAYRVLCASCDKWIRLRPNSTYCSIPWDAHRKSCLAKKSNVNAKNAYALEERNAMLAKDPDVRKFDAERILCGMCDKWLTTPMDDNLGAVHVWLQHRSTCQKTVSALKNVIANASAGGSMSADGEERKPVISNANGNASAGPSSSTSHRPLRPASGGAQQGHPHPQHQHGHPQGHQHPPPNGRAQAFTHPPPAHPSHHPRQSHPSHAPHGDAPYPHPSHAHAHGQAPTHLPHPDAPHLLLDLSPTNYAAPHESRRRNAEQRAATLRADVLIREVEPNRVFCSLCTKWVQLRQDSSYCAYPWLQHRGKCLARYQRRAQKASEIASIKAKRPIAGAGARSALDDSQQQHPSEDGDEPESEEGVDPAASSKRHAHPHSSHRRNAPPAHPPRAIPAGYAAAARPMPVPMNQKEWAAHQAAAAQQAQMQLHAQAQAQAQQMQGDDVDAEGEADDVDADGDSYMEDEGPGATPTRGYNGNGNGASHGGPSAILRRAVPASLADLDSPGGRRAFVFSSVEYLFRTTYEASDDMSVSALLTYLNAAMPTDKHEDFDTGEVVRAATALATREKDRFVLEGDMLRLLSESG
ncbi:hypothetical protein C8R47DRAFT_1297267 [Mycena vitilis]|nr:hypothetical protein C8R47DRAFT_1297267 [Mycena vitilis]